VTVQTLDLGTFVVGEKPTALEYQFLNSDNTVIDLTGYTAKFVYRERDGVASTANAAVSTPAQGKVTYTWLGTEMPTPGHYQAEFWVGNGAQRYASWLITWTVRTSTGPVPAI
jgi:hypothetical protein